MLDFLLALVHKKLLIKFKDCDLAVSTDGHGMIFIDGIRAQSKFVIVKWTYLIERLDFGSVKDIHQA